jgi:hypothetical protein
MDTPKRIKIIPYLHGKISPQGTLCEPDIHYLVEEWLHRHPEVKGREGDITISRGRWTLPNGVRTELVSVSMVMCSEIAGYDPGEDADLYEFFLAEEQE